MAKAVMYALLMAALILLLAIPNSPGKFSCSTGTCSQSWKDSISALYSNNIVKQLSRDTLLPLVKATDCDFSSSQSLSELTFPKTNFQCFEEKIELSTATVENNDYVYSASATYDCALKDG
jgi:hypothetical protein